MSDSLRPHEPQHTGLPCPSPSPRACSSSCPLSGWCHPAISSSAVPVSSCLQSFPASGSFLMSKLFASGGQVLEPQHQSFQWIFSISFRIDWSPCSPRDSQEFSNTTVQKHQSFGTQPSLWFSYHICIWLLEKPQLWLDRLLLENWCLCFLICCLYLS